MTAWTSPPANPWRNSTRWNGVPPLYDHASGEYLESVKDIADARREQAAGRRAAETRATSAEAQLGITELQLESAVSAREAAETRLDAAEAENRRLRELVRRMENR